MGETDTRMGTWLLIALALGGVMLYERGKADWPPLGPSGRARLRQVMIVRTTVVVFDSLGLPALEGW